MDRKLFFGRGEAHRERSDSLKAVREISGEIQGLVRTGHYYVSRSLGEVLSSDEAGRMLPTPVFSLIKDLLGEDSREPLAFLLDLGRGDQRELGSFSIGRLGDGELIFRFGGRGKRADFEYHDRMRRSTVMRDVDPSWAASLMELVKEDLKAGREAWKEGLVQNAKTAIDQLRKLDERGNGERFVETLEDVIYDLYSVAGGKPFTVFARGNSFADRRGDLVTMELATNLGSRDLSLVDAKEVYKRTRAGSYSLTFSGRRGGTGDIENAALRLGFSDSAGCEVVLNMDGLEFGAGLEYNFEQFMKGSRHHLFMTDGTLVPLFFSEWLYGWHGGDLLREALDALSGEV